MLADIQCCVLIERRELRLHTPRGTVRTHNRYTASTQQHPPTPTQQRTTTTHTHDTHDTHVDTHETLSVHDKLCHKRRTVRAESASGAPAGMRRAAACLTAHAVIKSQPHKVIVSMTKRANRSMKISNRRHRTLPQNTRASLLNRY